MSERDESRPSGQTEFSTSDSAAVQLLNLMADVRADFRTVHILVQKSGRFVAIDTSMGAGTIDEIADDGRRNSATSVGVSLDAELREKRNDRHAFAIGLSVTYVAGVWRAETELGWSCIEGGWDDLESRVESSSTFNEVAVGARAQMAWGLSRFVELIQAGYGTSIF